MKKAFLIAAGIAFLASGIFADAKGDEIAKKHYDLKKSQDTKATATMILKDKSGSKKTRKLEMFTQEGKDGKNSFVNFLEPADVSGTKFLTLAHKGSDSDQRLYLPGLKKTRKISSSSKDGEFVNSDFYYYDMEERYFEDYTYTFLSENETIADPAFAGKKFFKVEMKPVNKEAPYAKTIAWVGSDDYAIYKLECYDKKDNSLLKTITFPKIEKLEGVLVPTQTIVTNHKKGSSTELTLASVKVNTGVKADVFTVKNLEK